MRSRSALVACLQVGLGACLLAPLASAQTEPVMPKLGEHIFVPAPSIEEPFITTHVQTSVSLGRAFDTSRPSIELPDGSTIPAGKSEQFISSLGFAYQHAMKEWLAVQLALDVAGRLGANAPTLLSDGITGSVGYEVGWKLRIFESDTFLASGRFSLSNNAASFFNALLWAEGIVEGVDVPLVNSQSSLRGTVGLQGAWALDRRFGLLAALGMDYGESFTGLGENEVAGDARVGLSYDLLHDLRVPLGLVLSGGYAGVTAVESEDVWFWSARLALQSRTDFSIGLDLSGNYFSSPQYDAEIQFTSLSIDTRYFF